jgi:hypothetical protein
MLRSTASHKEQRKEVTMAIAKNSSRREIIRLPTESCGKYVIAQPPLTSIAHCCAKTRWILKTKQTKLHCAIRSSMRVQADRQNKGYGGKLGTNNTVHI